MLEARRILVDCKAIEDNFQLIRENIGRDTKPIWVVKSNVYGLGLEGIRHVSVPIAGYGIEDFISAENVLGQDHSKPVYILYPMSPSYCPERLLPQVWKGLIVPTVENRDQVEAWARLAHGHDAPGPSVQIKIRAFGGRFGASLEEAAAMVREARIHRIPIEGIFSHPSRSTVSSQAELEDECSRFVSHARRLAPDAFIHFADSTCILRGVGVGLDWVRTGMLPLGILPIKVKEPWSALRVVFSLRARVTSLRALDEGEWVGYTAKSEAKPDQVAIAAIGYAHGIPREISRWGYVSYQGKQIAYAAPPWMEFSPLALYASQKEKILDEEIEILGPEAPPHQFARDLGMMTEEFVTRLSLSIPREFVR